MELGRGGWGVFNGIKKMERVGWLMRLWVKFLGEFCFKAPSF